jgi:hypothetical protein
VVEDRPWMLLNNLQKSASAMESYPHQFHLPHCTLQELPDHPSPSLELKNSLTGISGSEDGGNWVYSTQLSRYIRGSLNGDDRLGRSLPPHHSFWTLITKSKREAVFQKSIIFIWIGEAPVTVREGDRMSSRNRYFDPMSQAGAFY